MRQRPTHLAARGLCWCAVLLVLLAVARATSAGTTLIAVGALLISAPLLRRRRSRRIKP